VDLIVGGPPCTPFSKSGYWIDYKRAGLDPDRYLLDHYVRFVKELKPRAFIMENVHALAYDNHNRSSLDALLESLEDLGYAIGRKVLVAAEFGVPQVRQRLFILGSRLGTPAFPTETHAGGNERRQLGCFFPRAQHDRPAVWSWNAYGRCSAYPPTIHDN